MKRIITLTLALLISMIALAQTEGISYQAVIIGPDDLELPGVDSEGNYLPTTDITVRFSIIAPGSGVVEFTEEQDTTTDEFGRINLIIGAGNYDDFEKIYWDGKPKSLKVEIDFRNGDGFVDLSVEKLTYVPYIQHRTIKASDSLIVDGNTELKGDLTVVNQPTNLGGTLNVNGGNSTNLSGRLEVDSLANFNNGINVNNKSITNLSGALIVGDSLTGPPNWDVDAPTILNGSLEVKGKSTFGALESRTLIVNDSTELKGVVAINSEDNQVKITTTLNGSDLDINNYPLLVEGGNQGIAIKVEGGRNNSNNFISFWDTSETRYTFDIDQSVLDGLYGEGGNPLGGGVRRQPGQTISGVDLPTATPTMWGRIEGETPSEYDNNADYNFDQTSLDYDIYDAGFDVAFALYDLAASFVQVTAASTSSTPCVGLGTCVTAPIPSFIVSSTAQSIAAGLQVVAAGVGVGIAANNKVKYNYNKNRFRGVTYASGAGDYAEYLLRENTNETMSYGDIVGVKGGKISKNLTGAEKIMVISHKPIVLGALPQKNEEHLYEKVAFMGQVPVKVFGKVNIGDYIIPSGKNDGIGVAMPQSKIKINQIKSIVGLAWTKSENTTGFNMINVAVGLNRNDNNIIVQKLNEEVSNQAAEIAYLKNQIQDILSSISNLEQGKVMGADNIEETHENGQTSKKHIQRKYNIVESHETDIIYFELTEDDFEKGLVLAEEMIRDSGEYERYKEPLERLKNDATFKSKFFNKLKSDLHKKIHYHKGIDKGGKH